VDDPARRSAALAAARPFRRDEQDATRGTERDDAAQLVALALHAQRAQRTPGGSRTSVAKYEVPIRVAT